MSERVEAQAKTSPTPITTQAQPQFQQRPFSAEVAPKTTQSVEQQPDIQTQLERINRFGDNFFGRVKVYADTPQVIQPKLVIGAPGDKYEQEADQVAARVMAMPNPVSQPSAQRQLSEESKSPLYASILRTAQRQEPQLPIHRKSLLQRSAELSAEKNNIQRLCESCKTELVEEGEVQRKSVDTSSDTVSEQQTSQSQIETSDSSQDIAPLASRIVENLMADPEDRSGQVMQLLARLSPPVRQAVLSQAQVQLPPQQQQSLRSILTRLASDRGEITESQPQEAASNREEIASSNPSQSQPETEQTATQSQTISQNRSSGKSATEATPDQSSDTSSSNPEGADIVGTNTPSSEAANAKLVETAPTRESNEQSPTSSINTPQTKTVGGRSTTAETSSNALSAQTSNNETSGSPSVQSRNGAELITPSPTGEGRGSSERGTANSRLQCPELQTPSARAQSTQELLDQVAATANNARQRFTDRITQGTEAIATSVQQQQAALIAAGEQQTGAIQALFANARTQVGEIISSAQAQLQTDATSHLASLEQGHTGTLEQVATTFSSGQERVQSLGDTYAERSLQAADESAQQVQTRIQGMAQEAESIGQEKAQVGGSTQEIAQAKAKAAHEIASDTATKITSGVSDAMRDLRATGPETARGFREQSQEAARQVGAGQAEVVNQLNTSNQQTGSGIQQAVTQGSQALGNLGTQLTGQLASLEQTIQNQLQTQIAQKSQEIYQAGQQAITTFQQQGQQAITSGDEHLAQFNQQLAGMDVDPELAAEVSGEIVGQVNGAYDNLIATTDGAFQQADGALTQAGTEVINAINAISTNASGQIQTFLGQAQGQVTQQVSTISGQLGTTVTQANTAGTGMVSQVTTSLDGQLGQIESAFGQGLEQYRGGLGEQVTSATEQAREPRQSVPGRIDEAQRRAEERAKNNWFVNQWNDFMEMVHSPGFWAGLITGLILGAIVVALVIGGVLTGGVAIVAAAALVGAIAAGVGTAVGNHAEGRPWHEGIVSNMIFGAFGGAVGAAALLFLGGVAAGAGLSAGATLALLTAGASVTAGIVTIIDNVAHKREWDKGLLANMALAGILTWIGGKIEGFVKGRTPGGGNRPPVEEPPGTEPPTRPPREPSSGGEEPPQGCFVAGTKVFTPQGERNIESLIVGDKVCALDTSSKEERVQLVECAFIRSVPTVLDIQIGETTITCSPEHPFWVPQQGWLKAKELQIGSTLFSLHQGDVTVEHIQIRTGTFTVYNIEVNGLHNYCVSSLGILVHNKAMRWNLQDRAVALRGKVSELIERANSLPEDAPGKADLLRQVQEIEPEASSLSRLAEESESPEALEPSRSSIESTEERLTRLEEAIDTASLPSRARSLPHRVRQIRGRAEELPNSVEKHEILGRLRELEQQAETVKGLAEEQPEAVESLESDILETEAELRSIEERIRELKPETPSEGNVPRPHLPHPQNHLPTGGDNPYVPPRQAGNPEVVRWPEGGGFEDVHGNKWEWARDQHAGPHWDVQHPDGSHTNVYPDGIVHQGSDNF